MSQSHHATSTRSSPALGSRDNFWGEVSPEPSDESDGLDDLRHHELRELVREECGIDHPAGDADDLRELLRTERADDYAEPGPCTSVEERAAWVAHDILRGAAPKHSPIAKHAPPYVNSMSDDLEAADVCTLTAWHWNGDADLIEESDRSALHRERIAVEMTDPVVHVPKRYEGPAYPEHDYRQHRRRSRYDPEHGYISGPELGDLPFSEFLDVVELVLDIARSRHSFSEPRLAGWRSDARALKQQPTTSDEQALTTILAEMFGEIDGD